MKYEIDRLLQQALLPAEEPDQRLNQRILKKVEEMEIMGKKKKKRIPAAGLVAAATLMFASIGVVAAWKYMVPGQVAEEFGDQGLAAAFQGEDAIEINETQEYCGYRITLLGIVSGKNLSRFMMSDEQGIREDRSYIVTAIENADGTPRPMVSDEAYGEDPFCVSPLIGGLNPWEYNVITMNGGYSEDVIDGIQYRIVECDNVEMFADRGLYLSVNDGTFFENSAYQMDPVTGEISRNEAYNGVNALFRLPIDASKADPEAAEAYIRELWAEDEEPDAQTEQPLEESSLYSAREARINGWTAEDFAANAELVESQVLTLVDGCISYQYNIGEDAYETIMVESMVFDEGETGFSDYRSYVEHKSDCSYVETFTKNEDGTVTFQLWRCPDAQAEPSMTPLSES